MNVDPLVYRIAFSSLRGITRSLAGEILARVGSEEQFFAHSSAQLGVVMGFRNKLFDDAYRASLIEKAKAEADFVAANRIKPLYFTDSDYPARLVDAPDAPLLLYSLGDTDLNRGHFIAVVGTRHATPYGIDFVNRLVADLVAKVDGPVTVVSGLAFGIDAAAHAASLKEGAPTVGVLAHGLNMIYPSQHRQMAADMVRSGSMLLTEYGIGAAVHKGNFVARNRIVAGLCDCLVVAESAKKGGALITAGLASGYNRDVFALPGRTSDRYSAGCNHLIASNVAALVENADDVIDAMRWQRKAIAEESVQPSLFAQLTAEEQTVVDYLTEHGEARLNQLTIALNMAVGRVMALLIDMEFRGLILTFPGGIYRLA